MGLAEALFVVFLILKLTSVIDWSWWWVTAPLWVSLVLTLLIVVGGGVGVSRTTKQLRKSL